MYVIRMGPKKVKSLLGHTNTYVVKTNYAERALNLIGYIQKETTESCGIEFKNRFIDGNLHAAKIPLK